MGKELEFIASERQEIACELWADDITNQIVFGGGKNGGKSYLGVKLIFGDALTYPETFYFIARQKLNDLRKYTIPSIHEGFKHWGLDIKRYAHFNGQDNYFSLHNGSRVYLLEAAYLPSDEYFERFGSMQMTRGWIEEGGEVVAQAKTNLWIACGRWNNDKYNLIPKLLITCNPKRNWLYTDFYKPYTAGTLERSKAFVKSLVTDNVFRQSDAVASLETLRGVQRERLYLGNWEYINDPSQLIAPECIDAIFSNDFVKPEGKKFVTADIARLGKDKTVIRVWQGWRVVERLEIAKGKITDAATAIKKLADKHVIPKHQVIADEDGVGGGVVDILGCKGFVANSRPIAIPKAPIPGKQDNSNYDNLKSQCGYYLAQQINDGNVYEEIKDEGLRDIIIEELSQLKEKAVEQDGKRGLMPKNKIKEALGRSPDELDTYLMRSFFDLSIAPGVGIVKPRSFEVAGNGRSDYNM